MRSNFCILISICSFLLVDELKGLRIRKKIKIVPKTETIKTEPLRRIPNEDKRRAKFLNPFSLFNVVQFPNTECTTASGQMGTCFTASECSSKGGEADGGCASGFGTCCSFSNTCDTTTQQNGTYFTSPSTIPSVCSLMITPLNENICQVRVNFETLSLLDPDAEGFCKTEYVQVTGGVTGTSVPTLCGNLDNQHVIYTPITNFPARLSIVTDQTSSSTSTSAWRIKILQYECDSPMLAPDGCLQFFTGISGNVSSFNYKTTENTLAATNPNQISSLNYNICLRRESGYCAVEWSTVGPTYDVKGTFSVSGDFSAAPSPVTASEAITRDANCVNDYVVIPQGYGTSSGSLPVDRYCGQALGGCSDATCTANVLGPIRTSVIPFSLGVVTDADETTASDVGNTGFQLFYKQQPCA